MKTSQWDTYEKDALREEQMRAFRRYLRDVIVPFSPHYRQVFAEHGLKPDDFQSPGDLAKLPFTSKQDLLSTPQDPERARRFIIQPEEAVLRKRPSTIAKALFRGSASVKESFEREFRPLIMTATTGRSSQPVAFVYTQFDLDNLAEAGRRMMQVCDSRRDWKHLNVFPFAPHLAFWQMHYAGLGFGTFCLSTGGGKVLGTEGNVAAVERLKPDAVIGMPTFLYHMLSMAVDRRIHWPNLRRMVLGGEKVPLGLREKLRALAADLGSEDLRIMSTYGFTEAKTAWPECCPGLDHAPHGFHVYPDFGIVEVVDPETGLAVGEGQPGEIVYTPLNARGSVVLRYRTGDLIERGISYEPCPNCGRSVPRLLGRISRVSNRKEMQLSKLKGTLIDFNELEHVLDNEPGVGAWQIELRKVHNDPLELDELILHIEPTSDLPRENLANAINQRFFASTEIRPNGILFEDAEAMRNRQGVGRALKEERIVDRRPTMPETINASKEAHPILETVS